MAEYEYEDIKYFYQFINMVEAIRKYKATPMISIAVVTTGPVEIAGS